MNRHSIFADPHLARRAQPSRAELTIAAAVGLALAAANGGCDSPLRVFRLAEAKLTPIAGSGVGGGVTFGHYEPTDPKVRPELSALSDELVLPDTEIRRLVIYDAERCDVDPASARAFDPPPAATTGRPDGELGPVRGRGGVAWFYLPPGLSPGAPPEGFYFDSTGIGAMTVDPSVPGSLLGKVAVVKAPDVAGGARGAWHACGVIRAIRRIEPQ
jgi:hypothetical protein